VDALRGAERPLFHGAACGGGSPFNQNQEQSQRQRTGVSAPHEQKQIPHRAWRPVRNDKELSGDLLGLFWSAASEDLQGGGVFSVVVGLYDDLHVLIEGDEEAQKALHGELAKVAAQQLGAEKQVPHRAWRPVRNDKEWSGDFSGSCRFGLPCRSARWR